jgi:hypothetical protein
MIIQWTKSVQLKVTKVDDCDVEYQEYIDVVAGSKDQVSCYDDREVTVDIDIHGKGEAFCVPRNLFINITALWESLGDVPIDEDECIEQSWNGFEKGTHREEVWHWFEDTFNISVAKDLMGL